MIDVSLNWTEKVNYFERYKDIESHLIYGRIPQRDIVVSITIPTYCRANQLEVAIQSALKQIGDVQYEIIVVDNYCEIDLETDELMRKYVSEHDNILYYRNEQNIGIAGNWNRCFELASGEYVLLLHDDDVLCDNYLKVVYPWLIKTNCTMAGVFHSDLYMENFSAEIDETYSKKVGKNQQILNKLRFEKPFLVKYTDIFANIYPSPVCSIHKKQTVMELGGFDGIDTGGAIDEKFFVNQIYNGKTIIIPQILSLRGVANNDSLRKEMQQQGMASKFLYGCYAIEKLGNRKKIRKFNLNVSVRFMAESVKGHFNKNSDFDEFLCELGVSKFVLNLPKPILKVLKYIPLLCLIFRETGVSRKRD